MDLKQMGTYERGKAITLENALNTAGLGLYNYIIMLASGLSLFAGLIVILAMSYVLPAADFEMNLSPVEKGLLTSMAFTGTLFSSYPVGYLTDKYGRRTVLIFSNYLSSIASIFAVFSPNTATLAAIWFVNGFLSAGMMSPAYVYVSEFVSSKGRTLALLVTAAIASLATTYLPGVAWLIIPLDFSINFGFININSWRFFVGLTALPALAANLILHFLPESPKYLLSKGKHDETLEGLNQMYKCNKLRSSTTFVITEVCLDFDDAEALKNEKVSTSFLKNMWMQTVTLFTKPLLGCTVLSCTIQLGIIGSYNVIALWLPEFVTQMNNYLNSHENYDVTLCEVLKQETQVIVYNIEENTGSYETANKPSINEAVFITTMTIGALQFVFFVISGILAKLLGNKTFIVICLLLSSISCLLLVFVKSMMATIILLASIILLLGAALPMTFSIVVDFFPTNVRATATCVCMIFGRLGSSGGSQLLGLMQQNYCTPSYYGLSIFLIVIAAICTTISPKK